MYGNEHTFAKHRDKTVALPLTMQPVTTMQSVNLLIVNDHLLVREALCALFRNRTDICIVGQVCDYGEAMGAAGDRAIDVVILDLALPGLRRIELIDALKSMQPALKILVLSALCDLPAVASAIAGGANGFLTPECDLAEMVRAIHHVSAGGRYVCSKLAHRMAMEMTNANFRPTPQRFAPVVALP